MDYLIMSSIQSSTPKMATYGCIPIVGYSWGVNKSFYEQSGSLGPKLILLFTMQIQVCETQKEMEESSLLQSLTEMECYCFLHKMALLASFHMIIEERLLF